MMTYIEVQYVSSARKLMGVGVHDQTV